MNHKLSDTNLSQEKVIEILEKHGEKISVQEAKIMLETMKTFAEIAVNQYLRVK